VADPTLIALLLASALLSATPAHAGTSVAPPPTLAVQSPPRLVAVPGTPVLYGPREPYTLFAYAGSYYSFHRGSWFRSAGPGNAWTAIATARVPDPVLAVPAAYYKISPSPPSKTH
jgi:hypothetical protein